MDPDYWRATLGKEIKNKARALEEKSNLWERILALQHDVEQWLQLGALQVVARFFWRNGSGLLGRLPTFDAEPTARYGC